MRGAGGVAASSDLIYQYAREQGEEYLWGEGDDDGAKKGDNEATTDQEDCTGALELSGKVELRIVQFGSPGRLHTELLASDKSRSGRSFLRTATLTEDLLGQRSGEADKPEQYEQPARSLARRRREI